MFGHNQRSMFPVATAKHGLHMNTIDRKFACRGLLTVARRPINEVEVVSVWLARIATACGRERTMLIRLGPAF